LMPNDVQKGDKVVFPKYGGTEVKISNEDYLIISEDEILGVIEGDDDKKKKK
jgi:chaperonin GroES